MIPIVPSKQVRDYFEEIGFSFSDFEKATILWNMPGYKWRERLDLLQELADATGDATTKQQIQDRICYEEAMLQAIKENPEGTYLYVVSDEDGYACGFFQNYDTAIKYVRKLQESCTVEKQLLVTGEEIPQVRCGVRVNPNLFPDWKEEEPEDYSGYAVAAVDFDQTGEISRIWSEEMPETEKDKVDEFRRERFESHFVKMPVPDYFQKGIPVRYLPTGEYGILAMGAEEWNSFLEEVERGLYVDYVDVSLPVVFLTKEGCWSHEHINPLLLEVGMPSAKVSDRKGFAMECALEALSDYWSEGADGQEEIVLRKCREYAEICREKSVVEEAKRIEEIMF